MKPFFGKQVIERPRAGSAAPSLKMRAVGRIDEDGEYDGPSRVSMAIGAVTRYSKKIREKNFTDLLGPLHRYLRGKIGVRWDDVFSELVQALGSGSHPIRHVLDSHILDRRRGFQERSFSGPLSVYTREGRFYVDERGLVQFELLGRQRWRVPAEPVRKVEISEGRYFVELKGIWYIGRWVEDAVCNPEWPNYGVGHGVRAKGYRFIKEKQANRKELKLLKNLLGSLA